MVLAAAFSPYYLKTISSSSSSSLVLSHNANKQCPVSSVFQKMFHPNENNNQNNSNDDRNLLNDADKLARRETLLTRLGGESALRTTIHVFYDKLTQHKSFEPYFEGVSVDKLKQHQYQFLAIAFTGIPREMDVITNIRKNHARLRAMGMDEHDFDIMAGYFVVTLQELDIPPDEIEEAVGVVMPLRAAFVKEE